MNFEDKDNFDPPLLLNKDKDPAMVFHFPDEKDDAQNHRKELNEGLMAFIDEMGEIDGEIFHIDEMGEIDGEFFRYVDILTKLLVDSVERLGWKIILAETSSLTMTRDTLF